jgi:cell division transport system ATP-binding protein
VIEFKNVSVAYELPNGLRRSVLDNVSLRVDQGELVYLIGQTGSGKSTLLRMLYMDLLPDQGVTRIGDYRSDTIKEKDIPYLRRSLGVIYQDFQLLPDRTIYDNVAFALHVTGKSGNVVRSRAMAVLARVGLSHKSKRFPHEISGGEQQRVSVARALVNEPWILLADEPTGNLDPRVADEIHKLLLSLNQQGMTVLMATHDYRLVKKYPSRTLALMNQQVVEIDPQSL